MNIRVRGLFSVLLLVAVCTIASCRSSDVQATTQPAPSPAVSGPCALLTQAEVETALGKGAAMTPTHNPRIGMDECVLTPAQSGKIEKIIVVVLPATGWDMVKKSYVDGKDVKEVRGLGDDAFAGRFMGYNVRKGQKYVKVFGPMTNDNAANDKATRYLAERAASRL